MDEVVTHAEVLEWLPRDVRDSLVKALEPKLRGWYTEEEAADYDGPLIEVTCMSDAEPRYIPRR